jgi:hypothetical protein
MQPTHVYEVRPRKDHRGFDLISDVLRFGRLWYSEPDDAVEYVKFFSRSHDAVIRVSDEAGNAIETQEHKGDFQRTAIPTFHLFVVARMEFHYEMPSGQCRCLQIIYTSFVC